MADSRQQVYAFIDQSITDPLNRQNTAEVVRAVLKYIVQHSANLADDGGLFNTPEGVTWLVKPTLQVSGNTLTVSEAEAEWLGVTVLYPETSFTLATPAEALERMDTVYANENGTYGVDAGPEGESAIAEQPPVGTLLAGFVLVGAAGGQVQPVSSAEDVNPVSLTDAVTVAYNTYQQGKVRPNAELSLAATPLLQTLSIANTQPGYYYQVRIKGCTGQQVTISPVSGVVYKNMTGTALTTVTLPDSGDCLLTYYHASSSERVIEVLAAVNGVSGKYVPITFTQNEEVTVGDKEVFWTFATPDTTGYFLFDHESLDYYRNRSAGGVTKNRHKTSIVDDEAQGTALWEWQNENEQYKAEKGLWASPTESYLYFKVTTKATNTVKEWQFRQDGKLYVNGEEFAGGGSGGITQAQLDTAIQNLKPTGLSTFAATNTFDKNKVMKLGGSGDTFNANHTLNKAASGNLMDTTLTVLVTGNGTNTVSVHSDWKNENGGTFNVTSGKKNVFRLHYIDDNNMFYTITQPV